MRIVRVQVYAREKYKAANGMFDIRSISLEAEVESSDSDISAIWELQRQADSTLESWINEHRFVETPNPIEADDYAKPPEPFDPVPF